MHPYTELPDTRLKADFLRVFVVVLAVHLALAWLIASAPTWRMPSRLESIAVDIGAAAPAVQRGLAQAVQAQSGQGGSAKAVPTPPPPRKNTAAQTQQSAQSSNKTVPALVRKDTPPDKDAALVSPAVPPAATQTATNALAPGVSTPAIAQGQADVKNESVKTFEPDVQAAYKDNPKPPYPKAAFRVGAEGTVDVAVEVNADGTVGAVKVARSSGNDALDQSALETIARWRFRSARKDGNLHKSVVVVPITFRLRAR
jgi:periplasmic protein TonB